MLNGKRSTISNTYLTIICILSRIYSQLEKIISKMMRGTKVKIPQRDKGRRGGIRWWNGSIVG